MTPYEEQLMRAQAVRAMQGGVRPPVTMESQVNKILPQAAPPPGMMSQSAGPSAAAIGSVADISGAERGIDAQRAIANQMRGRAAPKGRTVGPSGLYVGPNWGESLEYGLNQGLAGWMSGKANKADKDLAPKREQKARDQLAYQEELLAAARGYKTDERVAGQEHGTSERVAGQGFRAGENVLTREHGTSERLGGQLFRTLEREAGQGFTEDERAINNAFRSSEREAGEVASADAAGLVAVAAAKRQKENLAQDYASTKPATYGPSSGKGEKMAGILVEGIGVVHPKTGVPLPDNYILVDEDAEAALAGLNVAGDPSKGKLYGKRRVIPEEGGEPIYIGQNENGVMVEEGGSEAVDPTKYRDALSEKQIDTATTKLKVDLLDVNKLNTALGAYKDGFKEFAVGGETPTEYGDIPGQGRFSGKEGTVGYLGRMAESIYAQANDDETSPEILYGLARDIANVQIRDNAGLSQTAAEIARLKPVLEGEFGADPRVVREAIARIMNTMNNELEIMQDTLHPQVMERYTTAAGDGNLFNTENLKPLQFPDSRAKKNEAEVADDVNAQLRANRARQAEIQRKIDEEDNP